MSELRRILLTIEDLRRQLNQLSQGRSLLDADILEASRKLDQALNEYERLLHHEERQEDKREKSGDGGSDDGRLA